MYNRALAAMKACHGGTRFTNDGQPLGITPLQCLSYVLDQPVVACAAPGSGAGEGDRAGCRVVGRVSSQGLGGPASRGDVKCGVYVERCPCGVKIIAKMREAAALFEE